VIAALKRHPIPIQAFLDYSLVLTYAFPKAVLEPLLPPGLQLDVYGDFGFLAIALVQTRGLRPVGTPAFLGRDFFLSGYRVFARRVRPNGQILRGLRILRSDTDSRLMTLAGNALTHYNYQHCDVRSSRSGGILHLDIRTPRSVADLSLQAYVGGDAAVLPRASPFPDWKTARHFAGPLPFTFDYEASTHSLVIIEGVRENWLPRPVHVAVNKATFFDDSRFAASKPLLANAFFIERIPYRWKKGVREPL